MPVLGVEGLMFFAAAFLIAVFLIPLVIRYAQFRGWVDLPAKRKIHQIPVPRLGGVAIFIAMWSTWGIFAHLFPNMIPLEAARPMWGLFFGSLVIFCLGVFDDIIGANAKKKLLVQTLAAILVVFFDVGVDIIFNPFTGGDLLISHPWVGKFITLAWIVVVTNAINLIDGLDGLAGGVSFITAITIFFISKDLGIPHLPYFLLCMAGACLGFLIFNFSPARIFLGDSGSLVLGFVLAVTSIMGTVKRSTAVVMLGPPIVLALPMVDTLMAIVRRFLRTAAAQGDLSGYRSFLSPSNFAKRIRDIFEADQNHIHHALLKVGLSHSKAVMILYVVTAILGVTAYRIAVYNYIFSSMIVLGTLSLILFLFSRSVKQ